MFTYGIWQPLLRRNALCLLVLGVRLFVSGMRLRFCNAFHHVDAKHCVSAPHGDRNT